MALNTITPSNREEEYLSAIAGDEGASAPVPSNRREEWLRRIAESQVDQTDRLDHIEDQIPVDPAAEDVGKVMTVVEDTSGETPVYKWSAEPADSGKKLLFAKLVDTVDLNGGTSGALTISTTTIDNFAGDGAAAAFRAAMMAAYNSGDVKVWNDFIYEHIHILANGQRFTPAVTNIPAQTTLMFLCNVASPLTVSGTDIPGVACFRTAMNIDTTSTNLFVAQSSIFMAAGATTDVTVTPTNQRPRVRFEIILYL